MPNVVQLPPRGRVCARKLLGLRHGVVREVGDAFPRGYDGLRDNGEVGHDRHGVAVVGGAEVATDRGKKIASEHPGRKHLDTEETVPEPIVRKSEVALNARPRRDAAAGEERGQPFPFGEPFLVGSYIVYFQFVVINDFPPIINVGLCNALF